MIVLLQCMVPIVIILIIKFICDWLPDMRFNNYMPPEGHVVDHNASTRDLLNGASKSEVMRNTVNGKYTVKKDK